MPKLDLDAIPQVSRTGYPAPFAGAVQGRAVRKVTPVAGLEDFGVSHVELAPGAWSSQRHWHEGEDELVVMLSGAAVLIDDHGRTPLGPGDVAAFPKNDGNGHHIVNESAEPCVFVAIGRNPASDCHYPDIDMALDGASGRFVHRDGTPY